MGQSLVTTSQGWCQQRWPVLERANAYGDSVTAARKGERPVPNGSAATPSPRPQCQQAAEREQRQAARRGGRDKGLGQLWLHAVVREDLGQPLRVGRYRDDRVPLLG